MDDAVEAAPWTARVGSITSVAILVPVKDEQELLPRLLASINEAASAARQHHPDVSVVGIFALDHCTDKSADLVRDAGYVAVASSHHGVGAARRSAASWAIDGLSAQAIRGLWLANTDADSVVPENWLTHQLEQAAAGADLVVGTVRPVYGDLDEQREAAWRATHSNGQGLGHVHGANLGIRADAYLRVGGFRRLNEHEDVDLVERAVQAGAKLATSDQHPVSTSGRLFGRTEGGYAGYLREQLLPLAH